MTLLISGSKTAAIPRHTIAQLALVAPTIANQSGKDPMVDLQAFFAGAEDMPSGIRTMPKNKPMLADSVLYITWSRKWCKS